MTSPDEARGPGSFGFNGAAMLPIGGATMGSLYTEYQRQRDQQISQSMEDQKTAFTQGIVSYADGPSTMSLKPPFVHGSKDLMTLDPDPFGTKTARWALQNGSNPSAVGVGGLNIFGKAFSTEDLMKYDAGRKLLDIAQKNREGRKRGFWEAITDFQWSDLPFISLFASVGGSIRDAVQVSDTMKKLQNGEPVSDEEMIKTRLYMAENEYKSNGTWGATVGDIVRAAPGFMAEFFATSGVLSAARVGAIKLAGSGTKALTTLAVSRGNKILAREIAEDEIKRAVVKKVGDISASAFRKAAKELGDEALKDISSRMAVSLKGRLTDQFAKTVGTKHFDDAVIENIAKNLAEKSVARASSKLGASSAFTQFSTGLFQSAREWTSAGLLDFGSFGTESSTALFGAHNSAGAALKDALGILCVEAPLKGSMQYGVNYLATRPVAAVVGEDGRTVSAAQLGLQEAALLTDNKQLMDSAGAISMGINLLEYVSENSGRGFSSLFRSAGLAMGVGKPAVRAVEGEVGGLLMEAKKVEAGGFIRNLIRKSLGTTDDYATATAETRVTSVRNFINREAERLAKEAPEKAFGKIDDVAAARIASGNLDGVTDKALKEFIGGDSSKFLKRAIADEIAQKTGNLTHKSYFQYCLADFMVRHQLGPDEAMDAFQRMGYDGIVEEMMEERYSDFAKGLFGLDEYNNRDFGQRLRQAFENLFPGWDQLTAEAVGFAVPMLTRTATMRVQHALGGASELQRVRATARNMQIANSGFRVTEVRMGDYLDRIDGNIKNLEKEREDIQAERQKTLDAANREGVTDAEELKKITARYDEGLAGVQKRIDAQVESRDRTLKVNSVADIASANRDSIMFFAVTDTDTESGDLRKDKLRPDASSSQLARSYGAKQAYISDAWMIGKAMFDAEGVEDGERSLPWYKKVAGKTLGIAASIVSGDPSLAMRNYADWAAVDEGLSPFMSSELKELYVEMRRETKDSILKENTLLSTDAGIAGVRKDRSYVVTEEDIWNRMQDRYKAAASKVAEKHLAVMGVKMFSQTEMLDQAVLYSADKAGWSFDRESRIFTKKVDGQDKTVSFTEYYNENKKKVEDLRDDIAVATLRLLSDGNTAAARGFVKMPVDAPERERVALSLALQMAGFGHVDQTRELRKGTSMSDIMVAGGVNLRSDTLKRIADVSVAPDGKVDYSKASQNDILDIASKLRIPIDRGTDAELEKARRAVVNIARQLTGAVDKANVKTFVLKHNTASRLVDGAETYITATKRADGRWYFTADMKPDADAAPGEERIMTSSCGSIKKLVQTMKASGFTECPTRGITLTDASNVSTNDGLLLLRQLGLANTYLSKTVKKGKEGSGRALDYTYVHPALRKDAAGNYLYETDEEVDKVLRSEILLADMYARYRDDVSRYAGSDASAKRELRDRAKVMYDIVSGETGYMTVMDGILKDAGVTVPSETSLVSFTTGNNARYMMGVRMAQSHAQNPQFFIPVNYRNAQDYSGAILTASFTDAFARYRNLIRKGAPFNGTLVDFVRTVEKAATRALYSTETTKVQKEALRSMMADITVHKENPTARTFSELATAFAMFMTERDRESGQSSCVHSTAYQAIAAEVRNTSQFLRFYGLVDLMLGGDGFAFVTAANKFGVDRTGLPLRGVEKFMSLFHDGETESLKNAIKEFKPCGYEFNDFVAEVNRAAHSDAKTVPEGKEPPASKGSAFTLMADLRRVFSGAKFDTPADLNAAFKSLERVVRDDADLQEYVRNAGSSLRKILGDLTTQVSKLTAERDGVLAQLKDVEQSKGELAARTADERTRLQTESRRLTEALTDANKKVAELTNRIAEIEQQTRASVKGGETVPTTPAVTPDNLVPEVNEILTEDKMPPPPPAGVPSRLRRRLTISGKTVVNDNIVTHFDFDANGKVVVVEDPVVEEDLDDTARQFGATVVRTIAATRGTPSTQKLPQKDFTALVQTLFPSMPLTETEALFNVYQAQVENAKLRETEETEDDEDEGRQSDADRGYGDKALAEYNDETLKQFLKLASYSSPGTERGLQAFMIALRTNVNEMLEALPKKAPGTPRSRHAVIVEKLDQILNPRALKYAQTRENIALEQKLRDLDRKAKDAAKKGAPTADLKKEADEIRLQLYSSTTAPQREAIWRKAVNELDAGVGGISFDDVIADLLAEDENGHPADRQTAFLLAFLKGLDRPMRIRLMTLCANSAICSRGTIYPFAEKVDKETGVAEEAGLEIKPKAGRYASVGERVITASFMPLVGKSSTEIKGLVEQIKDNYRKVVAAGGFNMSLADATSKNFATKRRTLEHNLKAVAKVLAPVLGRESALVQAIRSSTLSDYYKESYRFDPYSRAEENVERIVSATQNVYSITAKTGSVEVKTDGGLPPLIKTVIDVMEALASERGTPGMAIDSRESIIAREEALSRICITAFACGLSDREGAAVGHKMAENSTAWALLLSDYTASQPETISPAELLPERSMKSSAEVAVSSRGIVPAISRWMDLPITDRTSFAYMAKNYMPGTSGAAYRAMSDAEFMEKVMPECRQTMTWPDAAHTPILAKNLSRDYTADEVYKACERQFTRRFRDGKEDHGNNIGTRWMVPVFAGDHSSGVLLQMPNTKSTDADGKRTCLGMDFPESAEYKKFADYMSRAIGLGMLGKDAKRSALTCLEAPAVALSGCRNDKDGSLKFGETRIHVLFNYSPEFLNSTGDARKQEALKGTMIGTGYGLEEQRKIAKDPKSRVAKLHYLSTSGMDLTMLKSLTSVVGEDSETTEGMFVKGSVEEALAQYLTKFRKADADISTSIMMDLDGYKVGPGVSALMGVSTGEKDTDGKPKTVALLRYVFDRLRGVDVKDSLSLSELDRLLGDGEEAPELPESATPEEKDRQKELYRPGTFAWVGADGKETRVTLADVLGLKDAEGKPAGGDAGIQVHVVEGLGGPALDFSYVDNSLMSYAVANVSHDATPENGRSPRNYMIDAITMAGSMLRAGLVDGGARKSVEDLLQLVSNWGLASSALETDDAAIENLRNEGRSSGLQELVDRGEDVHGLNAENQLAYDLFKRLRRALNIPMNKIDAALVSCGAVYDDGLGKVVDHTKDPFLRLMHLGSRVFSKREAQWRHTSRSLGLGQINVSSDGFRYGWHLDRKAFATAYGAEFEKMSARELCEHLEKELTSVYQADKAAAAAFRDGAADNYARYVEARKTARELRDKLTSCFTDHFGQRISEMKCSYEQHDAFTKDSGNNHDEYRWSVSFNDLFIASGGTDRVFDRSAFYFGNRDYRLPAENATGASHMAEDEDPIFLAGSTFGLPRTPSYNGSMWLQTLRASLPATVRTSEDGKTVHAGYDAMVVPDPQSLSILGCDHDGDKSQCYLPFVDTEMGWSECMNIPTPVDTDENGAATEIDFADDRFSHNQELKRRYVQQLTKAGLVLGRSTGKYEDGSSRAVYRMDDWSRNWVSNQFVQSLFDMARALPVDAGDKEKDFYGTRFAKATKARPLDKAAWDRLVSFADSSANFLKKSTVADTLTGAHVATSSQSSDRARGMIVSLASVLHLAQFSGKFRDTIFHGWSGDSLDRVQAWVDFMYHLDGISNATFDDIKEQICRRLGWTSGMMDTVIIDIFMSGVEAPRTDSEFVEALINYTRSVSERTSRYYMMISSEPADNNDEIVDLHKKMRKFFRPKAVKDRQKDFVPDGIYRQAVVDFFGFEATYGDRGETIYMPKPGAVVDDRVKKVIAALNAERLRRNTEAKALGGTQREITEPAMYRMLVDTVSRHAGVCPGSGYLYYIFTKVAKGHEDKLGDEVSGLLTWMIGQQIMGEARKFATAVNYTKSDPGDPAKITGHRPALDSFNRTMEDNAVRNGDTVQDIVDVSLNKMASANSTMYHAASIATLRGRGGLSLENRGAAVAALADRLQHSGVSSANARRIVTALMAADPLRSFDIAQLEANQQMLPYFVSVLRTMDPAISGSELMASEEQQWDTMAAIADAVSGDPSSTFALRKGIEAMFSVMYTLMSSSEAVKRCPAVLYFAMRQDKSWSGAYVKKGADDNEKPDHAYNGSGGVRRIAAFLRNKDAGSRARARQYVRMVMDGYFDALQRAELFSSGGNTAKSYVLSAENLKKFATEHMPKGLKSDVETVVKILNCLGEGTAIAPSTLFRQFLPLYTTFTERVSSNESVLDLMPDTYSRISAEQARLYSGALEDRATPVDPGMGVFDTACVVNMSPVNREILRILKSKATGDAKKVFTFDLSQVADELSDEILGYLANMDPSEPPSSDFNDNEKLRSLKRQLREREGDPRRNAGKRYMLDVLSPNGLIRTLHTFANEKLGPSVQEDRTREPEEETVVPDVGASKSTGADPRVERLVRLTRSLVSSWADVEYTDGGKSFVIRARNGLNGAASRRFGGGLRTAMALTVRIGTDRFINKDIDVNSPEVMSSFCAVTQGKLHLQVEDLMRLTEEERKALFDRYLQGGRSVRGAGGNFSLSLPMWTVSAEGLKTLAGEINLGENFDAGDFYHEYFHSMIGMFRTMDVFSDADVKVFQEKFGKPREGVDELFDEEAAAEAFRAYVLGLNRGEKTYTKVSSENQETVTSIFRKLLEAIKAFLHAMLEDFSFTDPGAGTYIFDMVINGYAAESREKALEIANASQTRDQFFRTLESDEKFAMTRAEPGETAEQAAEGRVLDIIETPMTTDPMRGYQITNGLEQELHNALMNELDPEGLLTGDGHVARTSAVSQLIRGIVDFRTRGTAEIPAPELTIVRNDPSTFNASQAIRWRLDTALSGDPVVGEAAKEAYIPMYSLGRALVREATDKATDEDLAIIRGASASVPFTQKLMAEKRMTSVRKQALVHIEQTAKAGVTQFLRLNHVGKKKGAKDDLLRNDLYMGLMSAYGNRHWGIRNLAVRSAMSKTRSFLTAPGERVGAKNHVTVNDYVGFLMASDQREVKTYIDELRDRLAKQREKAIARNGGMENRVSTAIYHILENLQEFDGLDTTTLLSDFDRWSSAFDMFNHEVFEGVERGEYDERIGDYGPYANTMSVTETAERNRGIYQLGTDAREDAVIQKMLRDTASVMFGVMASAKFFREIGLQPGAFRFSDFTAQSVAPIEFTRLFNEFGVGSDQLLTDEDIIQRNCQPSFVLTHVDDWYASTLPRMFGNAAIRDMFMASFRECRGVISNLVNAENFISSFFGVSRLDGRKLLKLVSRKGKFEMGDGFWHRVAEGKEHEYIGFDIHGGLVGGVTGIEFTEDEYRTVDMFLKVCGVLANGGTKYVTGINDIRFNSQTFVPDPTLYDNYDEIAELVTRKTNGDQTAIVHPAVMAMYRFGLQLHKEAMGTVDTSRMDDSGRPVMNGLDLYRKFVKGVCDAVRYANNLRNELLNKKALELTDAQYNDIVLRELEARGLIVTDQAEGTNEKSYDGHPLRHSGVVVINAREYEAMFKKSSAYDKLVKTGRDVKLADGTSMLDSKNVIAQYMTEWNKLRGIVRNHPWLTKGDGALFNNFETPFPFFSGTGMFMYHANRMARDTKALQTVKLGKHEHTFMLMCGNRDLLAAGVDATTSGMLAMLHDYFGTKEEGLDLLGALVNGEYAEGTQKAVDTGLVIDPNGNLTQVARAIYLKQLERRLMSIEGRRAEDFDDDGAIERMVAAWETANGGEGGTLAGATGMTDEQMFRLHGVLPANMQIGHKVHLAAKNIADALYSRSVLVNMLFTKGLEGNPVYYMNPAQFAVEAGGIPDSVWGAVAKWWATKTPGLRYDSAKTGVENARAMYALIAEKAKASDWTIHGRKFQTLTGDEISDSKSIEGVLCQADDPADDNVSGLNHIGGKHLHTFDGGEAIGYARQFFQTGRVPGGAKLQWMDHVLAWTKSLNVACSFFFPIATKWESPVAAVGALATLGSNLSPEFVRKHHGALNALQKAFTLGQKDGWLDENFIGFKDIIEMMDSNDPFLADLVMWAESLGITMSTHLRNPMEPDRGYLERDLQGFVDRIRKVTGSSQLAGKVDGILDVMLRRGSEKAFTYALNATKLAVACQVAMKLRAEAKRQGRAFDPIRDLSKLSAYIDSEVGGVDTLRYAWAHPMMQSILNRVFFSWQWTRTAWEAGGGPLFEDVLFGGHTLNKETRKYIVGRWLRMFGTVMIGVPVMAQFLIKALAVAAGRDDDDDKWWTWENEDKACWTAYDITPLMKVLAEYEPVARLAGGIVGGAVGFGSMGAMGALAGAVAGAVGTPIYTGGDEANSTTRNRRYYQHFGKQGWEFFRWFDSPGTQLVSKQNMWLQRIEEGMVGRSLSYMDRELPWNDTSLAERWLYPTKDSALLNLAKSVMPFTVSGLSTFGDAGILSMFGPVQMGASQTSVIDRMKKRLEQWATNDRRGYRFGRSMTKRRRNEVLHGILGDLIDEAHRNGIIDVEPLMTRALGQITPKIYGKMFDEATPDDPNDIDQRKVNKYWRSLARLGSTYKKAVASFDKRLKVRGIDLKKVDRSDRDRLLQALRAGRDNPFQAEQTGAQAPRYDY